MLSNLAWGVTGSVQLPFAAQGVPIPICSLGTLAGGWKISLAVRRRLLVLPGLCSPESPADSGAGSGDRGGSVAAGSCVYTAVPPAAAWG